jgi:hypothetical protein
MCVIWNSKENNDEDVKKENFFSFSSLLRSEIPSAYFSSFFCRPEKVVTLFLFFFLSRSLSQLPSYPTALLSLCCRVKFLSLMRNLVRLLFLSLGRKKKKKRKLLFSLTLIPIGQFVFLYSSLALFFSRAHTNIFFLSRVKRK